MAVVGSKTYNLTVAFITKSDEKYNMTIAGVKPTLTKAQIETFANAVIASNAIEAGDKGELKSLYSAKITESVVTKFEV